MWKPRSVAMGREARPYHPDVQRALANGHFRTRLCENASKYVE